jgi:hypothetical protein
MPTATPKIDPSADLKIAAPYELKPLDRVTAAAMEAAMGAALGSFQGLMQIGFRQAVVGDKQAAIVMVMEFPGLGTVDQPGFLDSLAGSMRGGSGKIEKATILGVPVRFVTTETQVMGVYQRHEGVVVAFSPTMKSTKAVVTALIKGEQ